MDVDSFNKVKKVLLDGDYVTSIVFYRSLFQRILLSPDSILALEKASCLLLHPVLAFNFYFKSNLS